MVEFMVIAAPRSGTTWASNWLTTDTSLCLHDPLYTRHYREWDAIETAKSLGISCTGIYHFPAWLNAHPARKVILHRSPQEINASQEAIGLPPAPAEQINSLWSIEGEHWDWKAIFDPTQAAVIYEYLLRRPFDAERHAELVHIEMQPKFSGLKVGAEVTRRLLEELGGIVRGER